MTPSTKRTTTTSTYEYGNVKVDVTDNTIDGQTERRVRIIDKSSVPPGSRAMITSLDLDGSAANDLAAILAGLSLWLSPNPQTR